jgi:chromosome segregation ATPase
LELRLQAEKEANEKLKATLDEKIEIIFERERQID